MAADGKNASGRLAAATVFWLLVAIFANQNYVDCQETQQEFDQRLQQLQQQQQQQQQQYQLLRQQQQQQPSPQQLSQLPPQLSLPQTQMPPSQPQPPPPPPQPQLPLPQPQLSQRPPNQQLDQLQQRPPNQQLDQQLQRPPNPQQDQQQQRPPNPLPELPQAPGMSGSMNMLKDMQQNINQLPEKSMNPDFGDVPITQLQQSLSNVGIPPNVLGGGRMPSLVGRPSMIPVTQVPNFDGTYLSQGTNPQVHLNSQFESNPNPPPLLTNPPPGQSQWRPPPREQISQAQVSMNNPQQKYPEQNMQQKLVMPVPPHMQYPLNQYFIRPSMGQQIPIPYQTQIYSNGNADNMYGIPVSTNSPAGYPGQSFPNINFGDLMRPAQMLTNLMPSDPMDFVQKPVGMIINSVNKLGRYGEGLKEGFSRAYTDVISKIFDHGELGARRVYDLGLSGTNAVLGLGRNFLIPDSRNQQTGDSSGKYHLQQQQQQQSMSSGYSFNPNQQAPPTHVGYPPMHPGGGQLAGGNVQLTPQNEYPQQRPGPNFQDTNNNPISVPQPIVRYGQD